MIAWDTSALISAYFSAEAGHGAAQRLLTGKSTQHGSQLLLLEMCSAVSRRLGRDRRKADAVLTLVRSHLKQFALVPLDSGALERAESLILRHRLRSADALHLAAALDTRRWMGGGRLRFITADREQAAAARAEGLAVLIPA